MSPARLLPGLVGTAMLLLVGAPQLATAANPATTTRSYSGPAGAVVGSTVSSVRADADLTGVGAGGVMVPLPAGRYRISVTDASGRPVTAQITAFDSNGPGFTMLRCDARQVRTPVLVGASKLYVTPLAGACTDATGVTLSAPTTGTVTITAS